MILRKVSTDVTCATGGLSIKQSTSMTLRLNSNYLKEGLVCKMKPAEISTTDESSMFHYQLI